jgi:hypothetical protein
MTREDWLIVGGCILFLLIVLVLGAWGVDVRPMHNGYVTIDANGMPVSMGN